MGTTQDRIRAKPCVLAGCSLHCVHHPSWQRPYLEKEFMKLFSMHRTM